MELLNFALLVEGITHIEDLPLKEFIRTVKSLKDKVVTEKLDGSNLWFGLDEKGLFTSREGKTPRKARFYSVNDYASVSAYNGFRAAHIALESVEPIIRKHLKIGDVVEIEVIFGQQPNTVDYGTSKNYIVLLRGVNETPEERVQALADALNDRDIPVRAVVVSSPDGDRVVKDKVAQNWQFVKVPPVSGDGINVQSAMELLKQLETFCAEKNEALPDLTNAEVAELNLTSIDKDKREAAKAAREAVNSKILNDYKAPIKEMLLNDFVRKMKPFLRGNDNDSESDVGIEGVVVRDPVTGSQTKIVDKDVFTAINTFNQSVKASIYGLVRTTKTDAPIESRGGVFGQAKIRIAQLLGNEDLAVSSKAKKYISQFQKADPQSTAVALANDLQLSHLASVRTKAASILDNAVSEVNAILNQFKNESDQFTLKLKTGKTIGITPEVMKRTLASFAETKLNINEVKQEILSARTGADLVMALYGRIIQSLFSGENTEMKEDLDNPFDLISSLSEDGDAGGGAAAGGGAGAATGASAAAGGAPSAVPASGTIAAGTTKAGSIAAYPKRIFRGKVVEKRPRGFKKRSKFAPPDFEPKDAQMGVGQGVSESKSYSLIASVSEEWAHVKDMKFATDVDDTAAAGGDVEFKQLRNNVNLSGDVTNMDVNRYLDKAHEINDGVDTTAFGMELDDGKVVKVYVNQQQAEDFEKALAELLGKEDDTEKAIDELSQKFDIVDVEWPEGYVGTNGEVTQDGEGGEDGSIEDENPDIDLTVDTGEGPVGDSEGDADIDTTVDDGGETGEGGAEGDEESEGGDEGGEPEDEDVNSTEEPEGDGEERDDFGQIVKKKKKKKAEPAEESAFLAGPLLTEAAAAAPTFANPAMQALADMLVAVGFDLEANRSISYQARRLITTNSPGLITAKQSAQLSKIQLARNTLSKALKLTPGTPTGNAAPSTTAPSTSNTSSTPTAESFSLLGSMLSEDTAWSIGKVGSLGIQLSAGGMVIKLEKPEAKKLKEGLKSGKNFSVTNTAGETVDFEADGDKYKVRRAEKASVYRVLQPSDLETIFAALE